MPRIPAADRFGVAPYIIQRLSREQAAELGNSDQLFVARGGFMGMNGNYSAGILEGLVYFFPETSRWID